MTDLVHNRALQSSSKEAIGLRLYELRRRMNYTQGVMATKLGVSDRAYKYYESGQRDAPVEVLVNAMIVTGEDLRWIILGHAPVEYDPELLGKTVLAAVDMLGAQSEAERSKAIKLARECYKSAKLKGTAPEDEVRNLAALFGGGEIGT